MTNQSLVSNISVHERTPASLVLLTYNQASRIGEAVNGALTQNYSPLEIILSDDCSTDSTYELMQSIADSYRGPHRIILNRNTNNLGVPAHLNKAVGLSRGEVIITAAGDDISLPERANRSVGVLNDNPSWHSAVSFVLACSENETTPIRFYPSSRRLSPIEVCLRWNDPSLGAAACYRRAVFDSYPPLPTHLMSEDGLLKLRAMMLGGHGVIPEILVRYSTTTSSFAKSARFGSENMRVLMQFKQDIQQDLKSRTLTRMVCNVILDAQLRSLANEKAHFLDMACMRAARRISEMIDRLKRSRMRRD